MGSGSSHLGSSPSSPRLTKVNRTKNKLASFFCGASSSSTSQREDCAAGSADYCQQNANKPSSPTNDSVSISNAETGFSSYSSPRTGRVASSESSTVSSESAFHHEDSQLESSGKRKCSFEGDEAASSRRFNTECKRHQQSLADSVDPSSSGQLQHLSLSSNRHGTSEIEDLNNGILQTSPEALSPSTMQHEELNQPAVFEEVSNVIGNLSSDLIPIPNASGTGIASQSHGGATSQEETPSGSELFVSDRAEAPPEGSLLHVDVVSISSNLLPNINNETSTRETRRNSRRMFWDAFSSRNSRRHADFPAILFTTEDSDPMGSNRRWLLDIGDDFFDDGVDAAEPWRFGRRSRFTNDRRRNSRSEFWDRLRGTATERSHRTICPLDLHPDGSCTCELDEETSALSSISRIILLAEALFEVLDEIHRQPESFSMSMLSVPAPESVVDSLPLKTYEKPSTTDHGDDVDQCYICLVEYEKGDKMRVLPCQHVYHMSCVDKWLKEIHGICPLCRGDVRGGATEVAASSSDTVLA